MIRRHVLSGLVAVAALSSSALASGAAPGIPAPPNAAPPFTIPSGAIPVAAPPSNPPAPVSSGTPTANPKPTNPLPGTSDTGIVAANPSVGPSMPSAPMPSGDSYFKGYDQDGYDRPDPSASGHWYADVYEQIYDSYYYFGEIEKWAYANYYGKWHSGASYESYKDVYEMYVYASYCRYYLQTYFWTYFTYDGHSVSPKVYDFDYEGQHFHTFAWRGYFAYNHYYYIAPMYRAYLSKAAAYKKNHGDYDAEVWYGGHSYGKYSDVHQNMKYYYHGLENCEYGYMSADTGAYHDAETPALEAAAGL